MSSMLLFSYNLVLLTGKIVKLNQVKSLEMRLDYRKIKLINYLALIYLFPYSLNSISIFLNYGATAVRTAMGNGDLGIESGVQWIITSWIVAPIFNAVIVIAIILYIFDNKNTKLMLLAILNLIIYTITFSGRWLLLRFILFVIFSLFLANRINREAVKKVKKQLYIILILVFFCLLFITSQRGFDEDILKTVVLYFTGSLSYFEQHLQNINEHVYLLGSGFFSGVIDIPLILLQKILSIDFIRPAEYIGTFTAQNIVIGEGIIFNGFGSALLDFWIDFGFFGPLINGFFLGKIIVYLYNSLRYQNIKVYSIFIFSLVLLVFTPIKWELDLQWSWMTIFFIIVFTKKKGVRKNVS